MFSKIEELLAKLSGNKDPQYYNGFRLLTFREHILYNLIIIFTSIVLGFFTDLFIFHNYSTFNTATVLGAAIALYLSSSWANWWLIFLALKKNSEKKLIYGSTIYHIWLSMSILFCILLIIISLINS